jgi:hypothetical protein
MTTDKDFHEDYNAKEGVWLAFAGTTSGKVAARARTARELAKMLGKNEISNILYGIRNAKKTRYCFFDTDEEADEYIRLGLHCTRAVLHVPTGNRWSEPEEAARHLGVPTRIITAIANANTTYAVKNFQYTTGLTSVKDNSLRIVCVMEHGTKRYKDIWETMPNEEYEKLKKAPSYTQFLEMKERERKQLATFVFKPEPRRECLSIPIKVLETSDYLATCKVGQKGKLISRKCGGKHPYKIELKNGRVVYARPDQVEVME